jgi:hypothetical protein
MCTFPAPFRTICPRHPPAKGAFFIAKIKAFLRNSQGIFGILCVAASQQGLQPCSGWSPNLSGVPSHSTYQIPSFLTSSL